MAGFLAHPFYIHTYNLSQRTKPPNSLTSLLAGTLAVTSQEIAYSDHSCRSLNRPLMKSTVL
jgi:hypothetical protein